MVVDPHAQIGLQRAEAEVEQNRSAVFRFQRFMISVEFGQRSTPVLCAGRVPLQFALLSPAGRPVAITADLAGFWGGAWADARRDMRGRYPRHDWPEDPSGAG